MANSFFSHGILAEIEEQKSLLNGFLSEIYRIDFRLLNNSYHTNKKIEFMYIRCSRACPWSASWGRSRCRPPGGWSRWTLSGRCPQPYTLINQLITQALGEWSCWTLSGDVLILIPEWMNQLITQASTRMEFLNTVRPMSSSLYLNEWMNHSIIQASTRMELLNAV